MSTSDPVNRPAHYTQGQEECIDAMMRHFQGQEYGPESANPAALCMYGFCMGNVFKYKWRAGLKESTSAEEDLQKAAWYEQMAAHVLFPDEAPDPRQVL